jgi:hypothetical protein
MVAAKPSFYRGLMQETVSNIVSMSICLKYFGKAYVGIAKSKYIEKSSAVATRSGKAKEDRSFDRCNCLSPYWKIGTAWLRSVSSR